MPPFQPIERPAPQPRIRPRGLLLDITVPIPLDGVRPTDGGETTFDPADRIVGGVKFCSEGCAHLVTQANRTCQFPFDEGDEDNELLDLPGSLPADEGADLVEDLTEFSSFAVFAGEEAPASFSAEYLDRLARKRFDMISAQVAHALLTGEDSTGESLGSPSLSTDATVVVDGPVTLANSLYVVEDLVRELDGLQVVIHASPGVFSLMVDEFDITQDDDDGLNRSPFRTQTGHILVGDAGHDGRIGPTGFSTAASGEEWIYVTQDVALWRGDLVPIGLESARFGRARNRRRAVLVQEALVAFDPCFVAAVQVAVPTYTESPGPGADDSGE